MNLGHRCPESSTVPSSCCCVLDFVMQVDRSVTCGTPDSEAGGVDASQKPAQPVSSNAFMCRVSVVVLLPHRSTET